MSASFAVDVTILDSFMEAIVVPEDIILKCGISCFPFC